MTVKHTPAQCKQAMTGIKELLEQIRRIDDEDVKKHICDSAIDICNNLLREAKK
jgi:hypothetical protein